MLNKLIRSLPNSILTPLYDIKYRNVELPYDINGYERIYHIHIRKTGGTSLNDMFLSLDGNDGRLVRSEVNKSPSNRVLINNKIYASWNKRVIEKGNYFYAFSHFPIHKLKIPPNTFTLTCFRDPSKRVISHYNMLRAFEASNSNHPCMSIEGKWLGNNFDDFLNNIPDMHLLNQIYMFSESIDISEAIENISNITHIMLTETFNEGVTELNRKTGLELQPTHSRKSIHNEVIPEHSLRRLREMLAPEYELLDKIREIL